MAKQIHVADANDRKPRKTANAKRKSDEAAQPRPEEAEPKPNEAAADNEADPLEALRRECDRLRDEKLRALADLRNFQERALREKTEAIRYAEAGLGRDLLVILDDLERTLESARNGSDAKAVCEGVRIVYENFLKVLRDRHIEAIEAQNQPFDPTFHEALMQQPNDEVPAGTVIQQVARGFKMHGRVLRPSRVIVSSGPVAALGNNPTDHEGS